MILSKSHFKVLPRLDLGAQPDVFQRRLDDPIAEGAFPAGSVDEGSE